MKKSYQTPEMKVLGIRSEERFVASCGFAQVTNDGHRTPVYNPADCHLQDFPFRGSVNNS